MALIDLQRDHLVKIGASQMKEAKRARGRPLGSGIDDSADLAAVADELTKYPSMRAMTAMGRVVDRSHALPSRDSAVSRLNRKWKIQRVELMRTAKERRENQQERMEVSAFALLFAKWNSPIWLDFVKRIDDQNRAIKEAEKILNPNGTVLASQMKNFDKYLLANTLNPSLLQRLASSHAR